MQAIIDYFVFIVNKFINILDTLKFPGSSSLLYYLLGAIIIGFIIKIVKGGSSEFEHSTNFLTPNIISTKASSYRMKNNERKQQIINKDNKLANDNMVYDHMSKGL